MSPALAVPLFLVSLVATLFAAGSFARRLDRLGIRIGLPETLLGVLTALAADAPELSSAIVALVRGDRSVGLGVVIGSNAFNLAAMVGLSALLAGGIRLRRETLFLEGSVGLLATICVAGLVARWLPPWATVALLAGLLLPYIALLLFGPRVGNLRRPRGFSGALARAVGEPHRHPRRTPAVTHFVWATELLIVPVVALIVLGSTGMVEAALSLAERWSLPRSLVGTLVLAVLTSLPNAFTAVRLGLAGRGSALVSETLNSNTINLAAGVALPALAITVAPLSGLLVFDLLWLIGMTAATVALLAGPRAGGRAAGAAIVALYAVFVGVQIARG